MGSEGRKRVTINVTGFKKFQGVGLNPTECIVNDLKDYVEKRGLAPGVQLGICFVLETAGEGARPMLYKVMESGLAAMNSLNDEDESSCVIWLHLGVDSDAYKFAIETQAVNEATFCCPDELGWQPHKTRIVSADGGITLARKTTCSVDAILQYLKNKGHDEDVTVSDDAGSFVCNYVYYHSLRFAEGKKVGHKSLFVHVPPFTRVDKAAQMEFTFALLEAIGSSTTT